MKKFTIRIKFRFQKIVLEKVQIYPACCMRIIDKKKKVRKEKEKEKYIYVITFLFFNTIRIFFIFFNITKKYFSIQ